MTSCASTSSGCSTACLSCATVGLSMSLSLRFETSASSSSSSSSSPSLTPPAAMAASASSPSVTYTAARSWKRRMTERRSSPPPPPSPAPPSPPRGDDAPPASSRRGSATYSISTASSPVAAAVAGASGSAPSVFRRLDALSSSSDSRRRFSSASLWAFLLSRLRLFFSAVVTFAMVRNVPRCPRISQDPALNLTLGSAYEMCLAPSGARDSIVEEILADTRFHCYYDLFATHTKMVGGDDELPPDDRLNARKKDHTLCCSRRNPLR